MNLADLIDAKIADVAQLPASLLAVLIEERAQLDDRAKRIGNVLDMALAERYGRGANGPGTSHIDDSGFDVKVTTPKRVSWDREGLTVLSDDDKLFEYIDWEPSVSESRWKAAPASVREALSPYRTEKLGKQKIEMIRRGNDDD